jgi:hypothetical protein
LVFYTGHTAILLACYAIKPPRNKIGLKRRSSVHFAAL